MRLALTITAILCISKQHLRVVHIEHWIWHVSIPACHAPFHYYNMFALPGMQDRHTGYRASGLQRNGIDGIVSADDERNVGVREVVVDLVHF